MKSKYQMIPYHLIEKATTGELESIKKILEHYHLLIVNRSLIFVKDEFGNRKMVIDDLLKGRIENRLIMKILSFQIYK